MGFFNFLLPNLSAHPLRFTKMPTLKAVRSEIECELSTNI